MSWMNWESVVEGTAAGAAGSLVYAALSSIRSWIDRPVLKAGRVNEHETTGGLVFDVFFENVGRTAFLEPTINIDGLTHDVVAFEDAAANWTYEGDRIIYNHPRSFLPGISFRLRFRVIDRANLGDQVEVRVLHMRGVTPTVRISIAELRAVKHAP